MIILESNRFEQPILPNKIMFCKNDVHTMIVPFDRDVDTDLVKSIAEGRFSNTKYRDVKVYKLVAWGDPFDFIDETEGDYMTVLNRLLVDKMYNIPVGFDFKDRTFNVYWDDKVRPFQKFTEVDKLRFYKYCVACIGNPKEVAIINVTKLDYRESPLNPLTRNATHA